MAFYDGYPVSPGHVLIIPKRHVASYFDLTNHEREAMNVVFQSVKQKVDGRYHLDRYNVGINVNEEADQSVFHVHIQDKLRTSYPLDNSERRIKFFFISPYMAYLQVYICHTL